MEKKMIGLLGAHRTGKTSLAVEFTAGNPMYDYMRTSTSEVFKELGFDPKQKLDIHERIFVQEEVLKQAEKSYKLVDSYSVLDRTPLDYAMYMLSECLPDAVGDPALSDKVLDYVDKCIDLTNRHFSTIVLIQPGIVAPDEDGKAKIVPAYQEHLNALGLGLLMDERVNVYKAVLPRDILAMEDRVETLKLIVGKIRQRNNRSMLEVTLQ